MAVTPKAHQSGQPEQPTPQWMLDDPELAEILKNIRANQRELTPEEEEASRRTQDLIDTIGLVNIDEI